MMRGFYQFQYIGQLSMADNCPFGYSDSRLGEFDVSSARDKGGVAAEAHVSSARDKGRRGGRSQGDGG